MKATVQTPKYRPSVSIRNLVAEQHSKNQVNKIISVVAGNQDYFDDLMRIFLGKDKELARRAAWSLSYIVIRDPSLVQKWFPKIIRNLLIENQHPAMYRNTFRFLEAIPIPRKYSAITIDAAFKFILNAANPVAIRAFAMSTAMNVVRSHPALAGELELVVRQMLNEESPGIRSRSKRVLAELEKIR